MLFFTLTTALFAHASRPASRFITAAPPPPANCENAIARRPDRLAEFAHLFPNEGEAFRASFRWSAVEGQLLGRPRRQAHDPPLFVVVPLAPGENDPILTVTFQPRHPELDFTLAAELKKLGSVFSLVHRFPRVERGISYPAGVLDLVLFGKPGVNNTATLGQVMNFATTMAALLPVKDTRRRLHLVE